MQRLFKTITNRFGMFRHLFYTHTKRYKCAKLLETIFAVLFVLVKKKKKEII